jgi:isocitrate/isopropylmalate dehydrogenase
MQSSNNSTHSVALIPADGIGRDGDGHSQVLKALEASLRSFKLEFTHYDWGPIDTSPRVNIYLKMLSLAQET